MSTLVPSGVPRESKDQDSTGSYSRSHGARPGATLGPDLLPSSHPARCPPVSPSIHRPFAGYEMWDIPASTPDEPGGRQTTGLRLPRYSLASREGTVQWRSRGHGRGCRHWHLTARHVTDDPMATKWPHPLPRGSCQSRIAGPEIRASHDVGSQNPRPATMLNHRPETSHNTGSQNPGPPHTGRPRIHMSQAQAGPQSVEPAPKSQSSRLSDSPRAWCSSHTGWTIFTPEDLVICQRQVSVSQTPTPSLYSRMCSKTLAPIFWETS